MELTNQQWHILERHFPEKELYQQPKGRPRIDPRKILEGVLWVLKSGAAWKTLPKRYPSYQTCHRRYQEWVKSGLLEIVLKELIDDLESRGGFRLGKSPIDCSFTSARNAALELVRLSEKKGAESWQLNTAMLFLSGYPLEVFHRVRSSSLKESASQLTPEPLKNVTANTGSTSHYSEEKTLCSNTHEVWRVSLHAGNNDAESNPGFKSARSTLSSLERRRYSDSIRKQTGKRYGRFANKYGRNMLSTPK